MPRNTPAPRRHRRAAQSLVQYALVLGLMAVVSIGSLQSLGAGTASSISLAAAALAGPSAAGGPAGGPAGGGCSLPGPATPTSPPLLYLATYLLVLGRRGSRATASGTSRTTTV